MPIHRGEVYFVNLSPTIGREQAGQRPVLVLSIDEVNRLPLVVTVVVGTSGANITRDYPMNVRVSTEQSGLPMETVFLCFQIRSIDPKRLPAQPAGRVSREMLERVETAVRYCLGL